MQQHASMNMRCSCTVVATLVVSLLQVRDFSSSKQSVAAAHTEVLTCKLEVVQPRSVTAQSLEADHNWEAVRIGSQSSGPNWEWHNLQPVLGLQFGFHARLSIEQPVSPSSDRMVTGQSNSITIFVDAPRVKHVHAAVEPRTLELQHQKSHNQSLYSPMLMEQYPGTRGGKAG
jgi:hypothetical protein